MARWLNALSNRSSLPGKSFPYTIRVVSEVLSSNGSTSIGISLRFNLALMDAGVPIKAPVSGVAMELVTDETGRYKILTDIQGTEDHLGDMDFKVAGTAQGITALQMDIKISGLSTQMMKEALEQAQVARMSIMGKMLEVIDKPRAELKPLAPRIITVKIPVEKIGALIGPGGKNIRALQEETGTKIDIEEDARFTLRPQTKTRKTRRNVSSRWANRRGRKHIHRQSRSHRRLRRVRGNCPA